MIGVRIATEDDAAGVADVYAPYVQGTAITLEDVAPSVDEWRGRIRRTLATYPFLVFEQDDRIKAYASASTHNERSGYRWSVNVGIYVAPDGHRQGVGRALYGRLLAMLEAQGFHTAYAGITLPNANSVGLHEAMGFALIGVYPEVGFKRGAWQDVGWWSRRLAAGPPRGEPIAFPNLPAG
jgi:phosphinothricin acetyltransferase